MTRPRGQVIAAADNAQRALGAGLPPKLLVVLAVARQRLDAGQQVVMVDDLREAIAHPAARVYDEMLIRRLTAQRG